MEGAGMSRPVELIEAELEEARRMRREANVLSTYTGMVSSVCAARRAADAAHDAVCKIWEKIKQAELVLHETKQEALQGLLMQSGNFAARKAIAKKAVAACFKVSYVEILEVREKAAKTLKLMKAAEAAKLAHREARALARPQDRRIEVLSKELRKARRAQK
jgi:hypothetical protein